MSDILRQPELDGDPRQRLGERLRLARKRAGLKQDEAADACGVGRHTLMRWESGEADPKATTLADLARIYRVTTDWMLGLSDSMTPLQPNRLLLSQTALETAQKLADHRTPATHWPNWLLRPPGLNIAAQLPFDITVVPPEEEEDYRRTIRSVVQHLLRKEPKR